MVVFGRGRKISLSILGELLKHTQYIQSHDHDLNMHMPKTAVTTKKEKKHTLPT